MLNRTQFICLLLPFFVCAEPLVYSEISDLRNPTIWDYRCLQRYILRGDRPELLKMRETLAEGGMLYDYDYRARHFRLIGRWPGQGPKFRVVPYRCSQKEKKVCVLTYASYNYHLPRGVYQLRETLKKVGFRGHFLYRIGGWPNVEEGDLTLAHVPYAFKVCFFREAKRLGYQLVLWLDASVRPLQNLESIFQEIEEQGYFFSEAGHTIEQYCNKDVMEALGVPVADAASVRSVAAGIVGLNLASVKGMAILDEWTAAARSQFGFYSARAEQNALSLVAHKLGLTKRANSEVFVLQREKIGSNTVFLIDYPSVR